MQLGRVNCDGIADGKLSVTSKHCDNDRPEWKGKMTDKETIDRLKKANGDLTSQISDMTMIATAVMKALKMPADSVVRETPQFAVALRAERDKLFKKCGKK